MVVEEAVIVLVAVVVVWVGFLSVADFPYQYVGVHLAEDSVSQAKFSH